MQVKVDILEGLQRKLTIEVPSEQVEEKVLAGLKKAQKTAKLDGFRKGKVPMNVIQQRYGSAVRQDVLGELIESSYVEAIKQEKLTPAAQPQITPVSGFAANEPFVYEAVLEIVPEFEVKGVDTLKIKKPVSSVLAKDVDNMIDTLRKQSATWHESKDAAVDGDRVIINFTGKIDGEVFEGGSAEDIPVVLGAKQMLPEFEEALFDKKVGDEVTATVNFPEDYHGKDVAGKTAEFAIEIKTVEKPKLAKVDKEFVTRFGIADGKKESLEKAIRENMERELEAGIRRSVNQQVMEHLVESNDVVIPEGMVAQEKERMAHERQLEQQIPDEAERQAVIDKQIQPDGKRVEAHIEKMAATYEDPQEVREYYKKNPNAVEQIYAQVMEEQLIDELLENAEVTEEKKSFDEVMQNPA